MLIYVNIIFSFFNRRYILFDYVTNVYPNTSILSSLNEIFDFHLTVNTKRSKTHF